MEIIKNLFYWFFGKALARFIGIECYAKIEALEELRFVPTIKRLRPYSIQVFFTAEGEVIHTSAIASNIEILDAKKLNVGTRIRIRYLRNRPSIIYISEFGYVYKEARFQ